MNNIHNGRVPDTMLTDLSSLAKTFQESFPEETKKPKTFHVSVDKLENQKLLNTVDKVRSHPFFKSLFCSIKKQGCHIENLTEMDEIYYSFPNYTGSDANMFISHYDGPYSKRVTEYVRVFRFLVAITPNSTVTTHFPHQKKSATLDFGDFIGWDYNNDLHHVSGEAEQGKPRILLKFHLAICNPCQNKEFLGTVKGWHAWYLHTLRNEHNVSKDANNDQNKRHAFILNAGRFVYTHLMWFVYTLLLFLAYLCYKYKFITETCRVFKNPIGIAPIIAFIIPLLICMVLIPHYYPLQVKKRIMMFAIFVAIAIAYSIQCMLKGGCNAWVTILTYIFFVLPLFTAFIILMSPYFIQQATFHY